MHITTTLGTTKRCSCYPSREWITMGVLLDVLVEVVHKSKPTTKLVGRHVLACCIKIYVKEMTMAKYEMLFMGLLIYIQESFT
jgi:hypothetical protein